MGFNLINSQKCFDLQLESNAEEQPLPRTASDNQPSQNLDPGILTDVRKTHTLEQTGEIEGQNHMIFILIIPCNE